MRKSIVLFVILFLFCAGQLTWAEEDKEPLTNEGEFQELSLDEFLGEKREEKKKKAEEIERKFKAWETKRQDRLAEYAKTLKSPKRFQAIKMEPLLLILDTKKGHLWMWRIYISAAHLTYMGQICPGEFMGEKVEFFFKED
jgi:hypothetical protein